MSAYVVSEDHIDALLRAGLRRGPGGSPLRWFAPNEERAESDYQRGEPWGESAVETAQRAIRELTDATCNETGRMLLMENARSVAHRYDETLEDACGNILTAVFPVDRVTGMRPMGRGAAIMVVTAEVATLVPVAVLKLIDSYEYQACEHPEWETSEAHAFCSALRRALIHELPGYDEAAWSL